MDLQELNKVYSAKTYTNKFLASDKQKDFIMDNISEQTYYNDEEQEEIMNNLDKLTKQEATNIISNMIMSIPRGVDFYDFEFWKD